MTAQHLKYYRRHTALGHLAFWWAAVRSRSGVRRLSLLNRQKDYQALEGDPRLLSLHGEFNQHLWDAQQQWSSHDYGASYFYQSCEPLGIRGLRDTAARVAALDLAGRLRGCRVLEIGCNAGFLSLAIARTAEQVVAFDINPHLIAIARRAAEYLHINNARFEAAAFEQREHTGPCDAVVSFANHCTFDGNTAQSVRDYFDRCRAALEPGGLLLFESHAPAYEGDSLAAVVTEIEARFDIEQRGTLEQGTFLDRGRTWIAARRPAGREI